jgi:hypothetical protein
VIGLSLGAASVVGLGVAVAFGAVTLSKLGDASAHCSSTGCDAEGVGATEDGKTAETVSLVTLGVSVLALGAGAWLWLSAGSPARGRTGSGTGTRIVPLFGARAGGLGVLGTW